MPNNTTANEPKSNTRFIIFSVAIVVLIIVVLLQTLVASAVSLGIMQKVIVETDKAVSCATQLDSHSDNNKAVIIDNIPEDCFSAIASVNVIDKNNTIILTEDITIDTTNIATSGTISNPTNVAGVTVLVNGWNIPTTWTYAEVTNDPIQPNPNTPGVTVNTTYTQNNPNQFCAVLNTTTTSTTPIPWLADLHIQGPPFNGDSNVSNYQIPSGYGVASSNSEKITIKGLNSGNNTITASTPRIITVCNYGTPPPNTVNPNAIFSKTETPHALNVYNVCKTVKVTVTGVPKFFSAWEITISGADLKSKFHNPNGGSLIIRSGDYYIKKTLPNNEYVISGNGWNTSGIRDDSPREFIACWA